MTTWQPIETVPPDFEKIAREWIAGTFVLQSRRDLQNTLVAQLRQMWNARGAADICAVYGASHTVNSIVAEIHGLDR